METPISQMRRHMDKTSSGSIGLRRVLHMVDESLLEPPHKGVAQPIYDGLASLLVLQYTVRSISKLVCTVYTQVMLARRIRIPIPSLNNQYSIMRPVSTCEARMNTNSIFFANQPQI